MHACRECPFSKRSEPGGLGGSPIEVYLGQIQGPFVLPCHMSYDGDGSKLKDAEGKGWDMDVVTRKPQCRGAAMLRMAMGLADRMPPGIMTLPPDDPNVFITLADFCFHHHPEIPMDAWKRLLSDRQIMQSLLMQAMSSPRIKVQAKVREG